MDHMVSADTVLSKWRSNVQVFSFAFALHLQFAPLFLWMFAFSVLDEDVCEGGQVWESLMGIVGF